MSIQEHCGELNRCNQRGGRMLSVFDLLEANTLDLDLAAWLDGIAHKDSWAPMRMALAYLDGRDLDALPSSDAEPEAAPAPPVVQALVAALGDEGEEVRAEAARSLGRLEVVSPGVIEGLIRALDDERQAVRWRAVESLVALGPGFGAVWPGIAAGSTGIAGEQTRVPLLAACRIVPRVEAVGQKETMAGAAD